MPSSKPYSQVDSLHKQAELDFSSPSSSVQPSQKETKPAGRSVCNKLAQSKANDPEQVAPPSPIDKAGIFTMYEQALQHCTAQLPLARWKHQPNGLQLDHARQRIGCAYGSGRIQITRHFIGTSEHAFLWDTLCHEMAHLAAGIRAKHGPAWRCVALSFGCDAKATARMPQALANNTRPRWQLWVLLQNGEELLLRHSHRRSQRFLKAKVGEYKVQGKAVIQFEYREHG